MKRAAPLVLCLAAAALAAGCGSPEGTGSASVRPGSDPTSCEGDVAVMSPYGRLDAGDTVQMNWARVALEKFNLDRGTDFGLTPSNVNADADTARREAERLARDPKVIGVVGPKTSAATRVAGPILDAAGLVYVSPSATNATLTDGSLRNFYRVVASDELQAPTMAEFIAERLKPRKVLVVRDDEPYSQGLAQGLMAKLAELGVRVKVIDITLVQKTFPEVVQAIGPDVDVLALPLLDVEQAKTIVRDAARNGKEPRVVGGDALFLEAFDVLGAFVTTYAPDASAGTESVDLVRLYQSIFGEFERYGAPAYVAMEVVLEAAYEACRKTGSVTREEVLHEVPEVRLVESVLGKPIAFTPEHELEGGTIQVYQVGSRGFKLVE